MPQTTPARFADKTDFEAKDYSLDWRNVIGNQAIESVVWRSWPESGVSFSNQTINGPVTGVRIGGGTPNTSYRIRAQITLQGTGEKLEAYSGDEPGISMRVLGFPVISGGLGTLRDDYGRGPY